MHTVLDKKTDSPLALQARVIWAVILRDIRTRFFGHGLGYLIAIAWPVVHIGVLLIVYQVSGRTTPFGTSLPLYFATGLVPVMSFLYIARFTMTAVIMNKPLTQLPAVKIFDLVMARALLEILASCCMTMLVLTILWLIGVDIVPRDIEQAFAALSASILLGVGFGVVNSILAAAIPGYILFFILVQIIIYMSSGVLVSPDAMPAAIRDAMSWNPIFHGVEWMRFAYYDSYTASALNRSYFLGMAVGLLFFGLLTERLVRGRLLQ